MAHSKDFTQKMIKKYPNVFTGIGNLDGTVKIDLQDALVPYQAGPRIVAYALQCAITRGIRQTNQTKNHCFLYRQMKNQSDATCLYV